MIPERQTFLARIVLPATSKKVLSWQVLTIASAYSVVLHIFASNDIGFESLPLRVLSSILSVFPMFLVIWVAQTIRRKSETAQAIQVLISYIIAGAARGVTLATLLHVLGSLQGGGWQVRIYAGAISMSITIAIITFFWTSYSDHVDAIVDLETETKNLRAALDEIENDFRATELDKVGEISAVIIADLKRIEVNPAEEHVAEIQRVINEHVRPLSLQMAVEVKGWQPEATYKTRVTFRESWFALDPVTKLPSRWFVLAISLAPMPAAYEMFGGFRAFLMGLAVFIALNPSVVLGFRLARRVIPRLKSPARELVFTLIMELIALPGVLASYLALLGTENPTAFVIAGLVTFPIYAWILSMGGALYEAVREKRRNLLEVSEKLRWVIARINLLSWYHRGVVSRLLHGPIQNSMHATVIRLKNRDSKSPVDNLIHELRDRIEQVSPTYASLTSKDIEAGLDSIVKLWNGIAQGTIEISQESLALLSTDSPAAVILQDLSNELFSNAVRHGKASTVSISIELAPESIRLTAIDNGTVPTFSKGQGLGQRFLDNCSIRWRSERIGESNLLEVLLPIQPQSISEELLH